MTLTLGFTVQSFRSHCYTRIYNKTAFSHDLSCFYKIYILTSLSNLFSSFNVNLETIWYNPKSEKDSKFTHPQSMPNEKICLIWKAFQINIKIQRHNCKDNKLISKLKANVCTCELPDRKREIIKGNPNVEKSLLNRFFFYQYCTTFRTRNHKNIICVYRDKI